MLVHRMISAKDWLIQGLNNDIKDPARLHSSAPSAMWPASSAGFPHGAECSYQQPELHVFLFTLRERKWEGLSLPWLSPKRPKELLRRKPQTHWLKVDQVSISEPIPVARANAMFWIPRSWMGFWDSQRGWHFNVGFKLLKAHPWN